MKRMASLITNVLFLIAVLLLFCENGHAKIYKYQDENGNWHFTDTPMEVEREVQTMGGEGESGEDEYETGDENAAAAGDPKDLTQKLTREKRPTNDIEKATLGTVIVTSPVGRGSGFFVSDDGYIITNKHVLVGVEQENSAIARSIQDKIEQAERSLEIEIRRVRRYEEDLEEKRAELYEKMDKVEEIEDYYERKRKSSQIERRLEELNAYEEQITRSRNSLLERENRLWREKEKIDSMHGKRPLENSYKITLIDNSDFYAYLISTSDDWDLALLKLDGYRTPYIERADSRSIPRGEDLYAIGNPINLEHSVARGVLSGREDGFIKTDAKIYPGNSGGPLVTKKGKVIGINTFKKLTYHFEGLGFAIPIDTAMEEFRSYLKVKRPASGDNRP